MSLVFLLFLILLDIIKVLIILVLGSLGLSPGLLRCLGIVSDHEVVKDGSRLDLPQVEAELAHLVVLANGLGLLLVVLGVINLGVDPGSLVVGVINLSGLPLALVLGVVDHGGLPLAVHLVVPVLGLGGVRVGDVLGLLPVLGLGVLRIVNLGGIDPVGGLAHLGVLDLLGGEEVPVISKGSLLGGLVIDEDLFSQ